MNLIEKFNHKPLYAFLGFDDGTQAAFIRVPYEDKDEMIRRWNAFEPGVLDAVLAAEPELEGRIPEELFAYVSSSAEATMATMRALVRLTKRNIMTALLGVPPAKPSHSERAL